MSWLQNSYRFIVASGLLLDDYPSTGGAWSVYRKLRDAYSGSAIRVRRDSDNSELDIGFSGNFLDTSALTTFVGANNGYVTTIYDQTTNGYDFAQADTAKQGRIVNSGSIETQNSTPAIYLDGSGDFYTAGDVLSAPDNFTYIIVSNKIGAGTHQLLNKGIGAAGAREWALAHVGTIVFNEDTNANNSVPGTVTVDAQVLKMGYYQDQTEIGYTENGDAWSTLATTVDIIDYSPNLNLFANPSGATTYEGYFQEAVVWLDDLSADRVALASNINTDYSIY